MKKFKVLNFLFALLLSFTFILIPNIVFASENYDKYAAFPEDEMLFDNWNDSGVNSGPTEDVIITLDTETKIDSIVTYHYWSEAGDSEGATISLVNQDTGVVYGPWEVVSDPEWWYVFPTENNILPAGDYKVVDSKPESWSYNRWSGYAGFTKIKGVPASAEQTGDETETNNAEAGNEAAANNAQAEEKNVENNPKTSDNIMQYGIASAIGVIGLIVSAMYVKKIK